MSTTDPIITHEDLPALRALRSDCSVFEKDEQRLLDRLIAAAEADLPPLPEGWYLFTDEDGTCSVWHLPARGGDLSQYDDGSGLVVLPLVNVRHRLTPLRPTVTKAEVEKVREALHKTYSHGIPMGAIDAAFAAAGIEVAP